MTDDYHTAEETERLNRMHEARTTDAVTLAEIVHEGVNDNIVSQERIINGEVNEVYALQLQNTGEVILRISRHAESNFLHEAWAIDEARKVGVPVPRVLTVGTLQTDEKPLHYSMQEKLTGTTFDRLLWSERISADRVRAITNEAGGILAKLHTIPTTGYGRIDDKGHGQYDTVKELMLGERLKHREAYTKLLVSQGLDISVIDRVLEAFENADQFLTKPHLIHRDYAPKHMFVDKHDHITGIIDWEDAKSGDATFDFSTWQFWFNDSGAPIDWLFEGYKRQANLGDNFEERFKVAQLYLLTGLVNYYVNDAPYPKWAETGTEAIKKITTRP